MAPWRGTTPGGSGLIWGLARSMAPFQNQCLRVITGTYWATLVSTLDAEVYTPLLNVYLDALVALAIQRVEDSEMAAKVEGACQEVCWYLQAHARTGGSPLLSPSTPSLSLQGGKAEWTREDQLDQVLLSQWRAQ